MLPSLLPQLGVAASLLLAVPPAPTYPWLAAAPKPQQALAQRFVPPAGCRRVAVPVGSWGAWLRGLPLLPAGTRFGSTTGS